MSETIQSNPSDQTKDSIILCENLVKIYKTKDIEVLALQGLDLSIKKGELAAIVGSSGSGKSTLLNMIGGLDRPSAGKLFVDGMDLFALNDSELSEYKSKTVGFVWQNNARNLIPYLTAVENVMIPMAFHGKSDSKKKERARELLDMTGIGHRANSKLTKLSGGEQQRIAIAIALANNPKIVLADEPTGSVDTSTADHILEVFRKVNKELGITVVIVTHDQQLKQKVERVVVIRDGKLSSEMIIRESIKDKLQNVSGFSDSNTHNEYTVLDRNGRLQLPKDILDQLGLDGNKLQIEVTGDNKVILSNPKGE